MEEMKRQRHNIEKKTRPAPMKKRIQMTLNRFESLHFVIVIAILLHGFLPTNLASAEPAKLSQAAIDSNISYFEQHLSRFPPDVEDSIEAKTIEAKLANFISQVISNEKILDPYKFNWTLGLLYSFAFNLDMKGAWEKCDSHLKKAIALQPDSVEPKIHLAAFYGSSGNPADSSFLQKQYYSLNLLSELRKDGKDVDHPIINYNLCLNAIMLGIQSLALDAGYAFWKQMPKDSSAASFRDLFEYKKSGCGHLSINGKNKFYKNDCFNFQVMYPETLILYLEQTDTIREQMATLHTQSPLAKNSVGRMIRNAIVVTAWDLSHVDLDVKIGGIIRRFGGGKMIPRDVKLPSLRSSYEYVLGNEPEAFHSILTMLVTKKNLFTIMYVATNSTYKQNLKYYEAFEKGLTITSEK